MAYIIVEEAISFTQAAVLEVDMSQVAMVVAFVVAMVVTVVAITAATAIAPITVVGASDWDWVLAWASVIPTAATTVMVIHTLLITTPTAIRPLHMHNHP